MATTGKRKVGSAVLLDSGDLEARIASRQRFTVTMAVTPEFAKELLARYDDGTGKIYNRTPGVTHVIKLARDMSHGHWLDTGVPIIIGTNGMVLDGRQRLEAVILSGQTIHFDVTYNVDPSAQLGMDRPRKRTFAHDLQMANVPNNNVVAAICGLILHWRSGKIYDRRETPTDMELREFEAENRELIQVASRQAGTIRTRVPLATMTVLGAMIYEGMLVNEDACVDFFGKLATGEDISDGNPILAYRNTLIRYDRRRKPPRTSQLYQGVHAWNLWRAGRTAKFLVVPPTITSETFPRMK